MRPRLKKKKVSYNGPNRLPSDMASETKEIDAAMTPVSPSSLSSLLGSMSEDPLVALLRHIRLTFMEHTDRTLISF